MDNSKDFHRSLNLYDATMIVAGSMIGSGIFIVSADIARTVQNGWYLLICWVLGGILTMIAAVSYGELAGMYPNVGGQYVYLKKSYNPLVAFVYGWSVFTIIETGAIAAVAVAFAKFTSYFIPLFSEKNAWIEIGKFSISGAQFLGIGMISFLTFSNLRGVEQGKWIQTFFTSTKIIALLGVLLVGFLWGFDVNTFTKNLDWHLDGAIDSCRGTLGCDVVFIGAAMVGALFSSDAWYNVTFIAGEIKNPKRNIPLSLFFGTLLVSCIYILINVVYLGVLSFSEIQHAELDRVGVVAVQKLFSNGAALMAILIMISTFGCNNGLILSGARLYYSMAQDGLFFRKAGTLNTKGVPQFALIIQWIWASALCLSGSYGALLDYTVFGALVFYILTIAGIFILRKKEPNTERPYKAFGYPFIPLLYIVLASSIALILLCSKPENTIPGLLLILSGIPIYWWFKKQNPSNTHSLPDTENEA